MAAFTGVRAILKTAPMRHLRRSSANSIQKSGRNFHVTTHSSSVDGFGGCRLMAAACIERKPVVSADRTRIEQEFGEMLEKIEFEKSLTGDHEFRHLEDLRRKERFASGTASEADLEAPPQTAQDFEDLATEEMNQFCIASRMTEADHQDDRKSTDRKLQRHLLLLVRGNSMAPNCSKAFGEWHLPCAEHKNGETLRQTAERALKEFCGVKLDVTMLGNAPIGYYNRIYSKNQRAHQDGFIGANVFFFRGHFIDGDVQSDIIDDHCWLTREEVEKILEKNSKYLKALKSCTYDERFTYEIRSPFANKVSTQRLVEKM